MFIFAETGENLLVKKHLIGINPINSSFNPINSNSSKIVESDSFSSEIIKRPDLETLENIVRYIAGGVQTTVWLQQFK